MADEIPRFSNLGFNPKLPEIELTKIVTAFINDRMLPNDPLLPETDIDRCRPDGQVRNNVPLFPETVGQVRNNVLLLPETQIHRCHLVGQVRNNVPLLAETDIDRCHPVGQIRNNVPSKIIGKFASYHFKHLKPTSIVIESVVDRAEWVDCWDLPSIVLISNTGAHVAYSVPCMVVKKGSLVRSPLSVNILPRNNFNCHPDVFLRFPKQISIVQYYLATNVFQSIWNWTSLKFVVR